MEKLSLSLIILLSGLSVVFFALIVLIFIIKYFGLVINKIQKNGEKNKSQNSIIESNRDNLKKENECDSISDELVAVITASIYSIYGTNNKIKSIKKSTNVLSKRPIWNSVGIFENTRPF